MCILDATVVIFGIDCMCNGITLAKFENFHHHNFVHLPLKFQVIQVCSAMQCINESNSNLQDMHSFLVAEYYKTVSLQVFCIHLR